MNNFAYRTQPFIQTTNPGDVWSKPITYTYENPMKNERFGGGFLLPFLTGAVVSAPFWYLGGANKSQQYYYQNQPYPMYYPYQSVDQPYPYYYPYPQYK